jgi:hypothetical protein
MRRDTTHFLATTLVLVATFCLGPFLSAYAWGGALVSLAWVSATAASVEWGDARPGTKRLARWIVPVVLVLEALSLWRGHVVMSSLQGACSLVLLVSAVVSLFRHLVRARRVTTEQLLASITLMLLLGVIFGVVYAVLDLLPLQPEAFAGLTTLEGEPGSMSSPRASELLYFSYVTLTTLGYGDITPLHPVARSMSVLEALTGQFYIAVLVARLVALHLMTSQERRNA